jgi:hypothetical protein
MVAHDHGIAVQVAAEQLGPIGRIDAADVVKLINFYEAQARK